MKDSRISWHDYFINNAKLLSLRSHDKRTKCGAILVSQNHEVVASGYNGTVRGIQDGVLPDFYGDDKIEQSKTSFMLHAEQNLLLSCARRGVSSYNTICYITTMPCMQCYQSLWQAGIQKIYIPKDHKIANMCNNERYQQEMQIIQSLMKHQLPIIEVEYNKNILCLN